MEEEHTGTTDPETDDDYVAHERLALPLLVPAGIFLFSILVIYGLSRIYLELNEIKIGDVTMATPLAIGAALAILVVAAYLAERPNVPRWQVASFAGVAVLLLTGGAIWAAVDDTGEAEHAAVTAEPTAENGAEPVAGAIEVSLDEFNVVPAEASVPAGPATFAVKNQGNIQHNFRVIKTDLDPDSLPLDEETFMAIEEELDVAAGSSNLDAGDSENVSADLESGSYVLICNIPTHYDAGMRVAFTVE